MIHECRYIDTKCICLANVVGLKCQNSETDIYQTQREWTHGTNQREARSRRARSKGQFPQPGEGVW
ncbi:uncharacterized protein LACBIDRAFT_314713 [Laccaria bicolor S238N-H82]|uniref:Predicted protein n=1 Tax=Laccaria bicolor (strain S238N-H82 / ATCC MYA-4686) TaxID=486041 RepID=B0DZ30_LACBS|nr:uncharacterized protein LACBIDRAFT_314713 [Laccaria bicolor S238N-H82]EDR00162.1 predicted protein [Laccaria bicolor S238N-H82]|eukprot:XP_001889219.1 predicted protein [Laccaria bicolor S238N-H82]